MKLIRSVRKRKIIPISKLVSSSIESSVMRPDVIFLMHKTNLIFTKLFSVETAETDFEEMTSVKKT